MDGLTRIWSESDNVGRFVALLLLAMSVASWVLILWKGWLLRRARRDIATAVPAFWDAGSLDDGRARLLAMDHEKVPFRAQNQLLAKLAPMQRNVVER